MRITKYAYTVNSADVQLEQQALKTNEKVNHVKLNIIFSIL